MRGMRPDMLVGAVYLLTGTAFFAMARGLPMGTLFRMGPGYFPMLVSVLLACLGVLSILAGMRARPTADEPRPRAEPIGLILAGALSFAFLIDRAGLLAAVAALLFFGCFRQLLARPIEVLAVYVVLSGLSVLVFVEGLGLPIAVVKW